VSLFGALAVTRFGMGARPGEIEAASRAPKDWLKRQLIPAAAAAYPDESFQSSSELLSQLISKYKMGRRQSQKTPPGKTQKKALQAMALSETKARVTHAVTPDYSFHERLVRFWSNHFSVAISNMQTRLIVGAYERAAIRPNILGSFSDLALNAVFHPAMLIYLNNNQSVGPSSPLGKRRNRGLNENLAREVLELHTVTTSAAYTQADVTNFARALTGWTVASPRIQPDQVGKAVFVPNMHESGSQSVLGRRYRDGGAQQAQAILRDLCVSQHTAQNIAFKLARHFIADDPPRRLVEALKRSFIRTGGDLKALYMVLIESEESWVRAAGKVKTPDELIVSTGRLIGLKPVLTKQPRQLFESFAQIPFRAPSPAGWPDEAAAWTGPDAMMKRIEWINEMSVRHPDLDAGQLLREGLGDRVSPETLQAIQRAESSSQALVLALMSPEFQMR